MYKDEDESETDDSREGGRRGDSPCEAGEELEGREQVGERRVGEVVCIFCFLS